MIDVIKGLSLAAILILAGVVAEISVNEAIAADDSINEEWNTSYSLGKFSNSDPPKSDEIFKVYYRVINGTVDNLTTHPLEVIANVTSSNSSGGILEVQYPRNYPYTNDPNLVTAGIDNFIIYAQRLGEPEVQISGNGSTTDCFFVLSIPFTGKVGIGIYSSYLPEDYAFHGDNIQESCISDTIVKANTIPPLKQLRAGVAAEDVACKEGMELVIDPNGKPYCATTSSEQILKERWNL